MGPIGNYPHLFTIITNDGLSDRLLMQSVSMHDAYIDARYKLKLHARQTESKRSLKRNKYKRGSKRM